MDFNGRIKRMLVHPLFISLILSLVIYAFVPFKVEKYKTEMVSLVRKSENADIYYFDLDGDGESEKIDFLKTPLTGIMVSSKGRVLDQWNFGPTFSVSPNTQHGMTFKDVDNDGNSDILLVTYNGKDILMHVFSPMMGNILFQDKKIAEYRMVNDEIGTSVKFIDVYDYNRDGFNEIYYTLETGYAVHPRGMYALDFITDTIMSSPEGGNLYVRPKKGDVDRDGEPEFYAESMAVGNGSPDDPFTDHASWFMVFSPEMQLRFPPKKTGIYPSSFQIDQYDLDGESMFAGLHLYMGPEDLPCYFALYDDRGKMIGKREFEYSAGWHEATLLPQTSPDVIPVLKKDGTLLLYDHNLDLTNSIRIPPLKDTHPVSLDVDQDGQTEFIFLSEHADKVIVVQNDFTGYTEIDLPENVPDPKYSLKLSEENPPEIFVNGNEYNYSFHYFANPYYPFRWLLFPGFFVVVLGFISGLDKLQKIRLTQKYKAERQLIELQLKSIRNQLDPHFTLNLLASIGDLFDKKDEKTKRYIFSKYTTLLCNTILHADRFTVSLLSELEFVRDYLTLEKFRFDDRLEFEINKDGVSEKIIVPKMLVHSFVENAVKHGIRPRGEGKIEIRCELKGKNCITTVRDNGIGRRNSKDATKFSTGKGLSITDRIIENYGYLKNAKIHYRIRDLKDEQGEALGTEVVIHIPV